MPTHEPSWQANDPVRTGWQLPLPTAASISLKPVAINNSEQCLHCRLKLTADYHSVQPLALERFPQLPIWVARPHPGLLRKRTEPAWRTAQLAPDSVSLLLQYIRLPVPALDDPLSAGLFHRLSSLGGGVHNPVCSEPVGRECRQGDLKLGSPYKNKDLHSVLVDKTLQMPDEWIFD